MTAKILAFPTGKHIPGLTKEQREPIEKKIAREQTKKYANAVADDIVIGLLTQLQQEGLGIGKSDPKLPFSKVSFAVFSAFFEAFSP